jgi:hypothetical protein
MTQEGGVKRESSGLLSFHRLFHSRVYLPKEDISCDLSGIKMTSQISPCYLEGSTYNEPGLYPYLRSTRNTQVESRTLLATSRTEPHRNLLPGCGVNKTLQSQKW